MARPRDQRQRLRAKRAESESLRTLLAGGDRRSLARSDAALKLLRADEHRVAELARLADDGDWLVVMRAMDLMEKLARERPDWIQPHRDLFIGALAQHESWEIRLQIARALPLFQWTPGERERAVAILLDYVGQPQKFVKAWALDSLARFAESESALMPKVEAFLSEFERSGSGALVSRARQIRRRLAACAGAAKSAGA